MSGGKADKKNSGTKKVGTISMEARLESILKKTRVSSGQPFNFQSIEPPGKYLISENVIEDFFDVYSHCIKMGRILTMQEKPEAYGPLRVDFDIKSELEVGSRRQYDDEFLKKIVKMYQEAIYSVVHDDEYKPIMGTCIILTKQKPRKEGSVIKDGFHLHFPYFICESWMQDKHLRNMVSERIVEENVTRKLSHIEPADKLIDSDIAKKPWIMYGSSKKIGAEPYKLYKIYNVNLKEISVKKAFKSEEFGKKSDPDFFLPRLLSIRGYTETTSLKNEVESKRCCYEISRKKANIHRNRSDVDIMEDLKKIQDEELMEMLSDERAEDYNSWIDVGWTLFNIGQGVDEALNMWIEFSKRSSKFVEGTCENEWSKMKLSNKTLGSLYFMAKEDSPDQFKNMRNTNVNNLIAQCIRDPKPNEWKIAMVFCKKYENRFVCTGFKREIWYEFAGHIWNEIDGAHSILKLFPTEFFSLFNSYLKGLQANSENLEGDEQSENTKKQSKCLKIMELLQTSSFHTNLLKMVKLEFYDAKFIQKRDQQMHLFACANGVLDLKAQVFRPGRPDDYITLTNGRNYIEYNGDESDIDVFKDFIKKTFPNENRHEYFLDACCSSLEGGNVNKIVMILTGQLGDNGKSQLVNWLQTMFGNEANGHAVVFPRELFVGKDNGSASARPDLAQIRGKRIGFVSELTRQETINIGRLKELTGSDKIWARELYEKGTNIRAMFTLWLQCNVPPKVPGNDTATWNRLRNLECESKFVLKKHEREFPVPESVEEQFAMKRFKADPNFGDKIPMLADVGLWFLFRRFAEYKKRGLVEPPEVVMATESYRANNDVILNFIIDSVVKVEPTEENDEKPFLSFNEMADAFYLWFRQRKSEYGFGENPARSTLKEEFNRRLNFFGKKDRLDGWYGYALDKGEDFPGVVVPPVTNSDSSKNSKSKDDKDKKSRKKKSKDESKDESNDNSTKDESNDNSIKERPKKRKRSTIFELAFE